MILPDVNVLLYAYRTQSDRHREYRSWLQSVVDGDSAFGLSEQALASVVRIATNPKVFRGAASLGDALSFVRGLVRHPRCRLIRPQDRHFAIFTDLCERSGAKGNLVADAWFAALAIESGCTWITADRDFARFPGLKWKHPLDHDHVIENPG